MKICILASGSRGNSLYVETEQSCFLVDVGLSAREIEQRLQSKDLNPQKINAIVLTHAHGDHVKGVGVLANRYGIPVYAHPDTIMGITKRIKPGQVTHPVSGPFTINGVRLTPFKVPHDCEPTCGYLIEENDKVFVVCCDLGYVTDEVRRRVSRANVLLLECNHDPEMLMNGPYPWDLKDRIKGRLGHLSNHQTGELLNEVLGPELKYVILGHLSQKNNTPELAKRTVFKYIKSQYQSRIDVIEQKTVSHIYTL